MDDVSKPVVAAAPRPGWWAKTKHLVVHKILHLDDTPHRIALGVFLGFLVGMTPTLGFQMLIYVALAAIVGANKLSGIPPIWISNPLTAVPLYYGNWKLGRFLVSGQLESSSESKAMIESVMASEGPSIGVTHTEFWREALRLLVDLGLELWIGSLFVGLVTGGLAYWLTYRAVLAYRARRDASAMR